MDVIATVRDDRTRSATRLALSQLHSSLQSLGGEAERSLVRRQLAVACAVYPLRGRLTSAYRRPHALSAAVDKRSIAGRVEGTQGMLRPCKRLRNLRRR